MLHIRGVTVGKKGNIDDRVYITFTIEGLIDIFERNNDCGGRC